jgi:aspartyl-tRNA(Asn)/glutamyl-tRNA(Gln) amidotransferase subunit B
MEEGSLRCDANVSVRHRGADKFGTKVELKNLNSFRFLQKALEYEIDRQIELIEAGDVVVQETRLWNEHESRTYSMRSKEEAHDYRYFPEPDLPLLIVSESLVEKLRGELPELPEAKRRRFIAHYGLAHDDAAQLSDSAELADYFETVAQASGNARASANWVLNELMREIKAASSDAKTVPVTAQSLGSLIRMIDSGGISGKMAKDVLTKMAQSARSAEEIVQEMGGSQISDEAAIRELVDQVLLANPRQLEQYRSGKTGLIGFFVGQVMKVSGGRANPQLVNEILKKALEN